MVDAIRLGRLSVRDSERIDMGGGPGIMENGRQGGSRVECRLYLKGKVARPSDEAYAS